MLRFHMYELNQNNEEKAWFGSLHNLIWACYQNESILFLTLISFLK